MGAVRATEPESHALSGQHLRLKLAAVRLLTSAPIDRLLRNRRIPYGAARLLRVRIPDPSAASVTAAAVFFGVYEPSERRSIQRGFPVDLPIVELGSGIGVISSLLAFSMTKGPLVCVEANERLHDILCDNIAGNNPHGVEVHVVGKAVGASAGAGVFLRDDDHLGSRSATSEPTGDGSKLVEVQTVTLAELTDQFSEYALICDVEGAEAAFIFAPDGLQGCAWMCIELHDTTWDGQPRSIDDLHAGVLAHGFNLEYVDGSVRVYSRPGAGADERAGE